MLKKIEKLEDISNKGLEALGKILTAAWFKVIPKPVINKIIAFKLAIIAFFLKIKQYTMGKVEQVKTFHAERKLKAAKAAQAGESGALKQKALDQVANIKSILLKTPLRSRADGIAKNLTKFLDKCAAIPKTQAIIAASAMTMIFFGTYGVYVSGQKIYMQEWGTRAPASAEKYLDRAEYLKYPARTLKVFNVKIPIYVESVKSVRSVTVDFTVRTDTRFARQFLEEYEYKLKDYFFMTTEPMISTFPLEDEGKMVLKDKIQDELNIFLEDEKVEGRVLEVDIIFIVGS